MSSKIQDNTVPYRILKVVADLCIPRSYKRFTVVGADNIPTDGSVIWAANHTNALMDPLVLLAATRQRKVYVARADIFKKPIVIKALTFLKIFPIYRIRDGFDSVKKNDEIIEKTAQVLADHVPLCIFPEATHRPKHSLLKLSKGIFHIALAVREKNDSEPVYILPIGIEYGDYFRYHSNVLINFGKPFNVSEFLDENKDLPLPVQMQKMRDILSQKMAEQISYIPDDVDYDAIWEYTKIHADNRKYFAETLAEIDPEKKLKGLQRRLAVNKKAIADALALREQNPESAKELFQKYEDRRLWRIQRGISVHSIAENPGLGRILLKTLGIVAGFPYFAFSAITYLPVWLLSWFVVGHVKDDAFYNSARFCIRVFLSWICFIVWASVFFCHMPVALASVLTLLLLPGYSFFSDYREFARIYMSDLRWIARKKNAPQV